MPNHGHMKNRENTPEFKGEKKDHNPQENKNDKPKSDENKPKSNA